MVTAGDGLIVGMVYVLHYKFIKETQKTNKGEPKSETYISRNGRSCTGIGT